MQHCPDCGDINWNNWFNMICYDDEIGDWNSTEDWVLKTWDNLNVVDYDDYNLNKLRNNNLNCGFSICNNCGLVAS